MKYFKYLAVLLLGLIPMFAFGADVVPRGNVDGWTLHTMGNGAAIHSVLSSIKMVLNPSDGGGSFRLLMLFMAVTGFCIMAVQAGFNPGQNLFKMFSYILVAWAVTYSTTGITARVFISDPVTNYYATESDVPAIVAIPASLVSEIGHYMTTQIQQAYSTPEESSLTNGGFDIFGKVQRDLDQYVVTRPELQQSMSAYIADCAIAALAQKRITANELQSSTDLMGLLEKAKSKVFLTRYWPAAASSNVPIATLQSNVVDCDTAYTALKTDMELHAQQLLKASTQEWTQSGVMVPFEQMMQSYLEAAHQGKTGGGGTYGRPTGIITQKALINSLNGDFRNAAIQTGNNELLMGVSISQAEQSQKSGWVTSAAIFQNMMGYVYTTLQAFIFAVVPIVIVALLVPGLGKKIFVNYGQILVWLTLWEPMLSVVNYLVTLFRLEGLSKAVAASGGFNMANAWVISEGANNMVIAASFLGTMVPLLCWGLVSGAMAFTDFVSHGIGSSFAMQAGAQAATGAMSLNNMSMNNLSNNKFDSAHKSTVGNQSVMAFENAGSMSTVDDRGGHQILKDGAGLSSKGSLSSANAESAGTSQAASSAVTSAEGASANQDAKVGTSNSDKTSRSQADHVETGKSSGTNAAHSDTAGTDQSVGTSNKQSQSGDIKDSTTLTTSVGADGKLGGGGGGAGAGGKGGAGGMKAPGVSGGVGANQASLNSSTVGAGTDVSGSESTKAGNSDTVTKTAGTTDGQGRRETLTRDQAFGTDNSRGEGVGSNVSTGKAGGVTDTSTVGTTATRTQSSTLDWGNGVTADDAAAADKLQNAGFGSIADARAAHDSALTTAQAAYAERSGTIGAASARLAGAGANPGAFGHTGFAGGGADMSTLTQATAAVAKTTADVGAEFKKRDGAATDFMKGNLEGSQSFLSGQKSITAGTGGSAFGLTDDMSAKKMGLAGGIGWGTVSSLAAGGGAVAQGWNAIRGGGAVAAGGGAIAGSGSALGGTAATAGTVTAGGLAVGTLGVGVAGYAGWQAGRELSGLIGQDRIDAALTPAFMKFDQYTNNYFH